MFSGNAQSSILPGSAAMQQQQERVECEKSVNSSKEYASQIKKYKQNIFFVFFFRKSSLLLFVRRLRLVSAMVTYSLLHPFPEGDVDKRKQLNIASETLHLAFFNH